MYATLADMLARFEAAELVQLAQAEDAADPVLATRVVTALTRAQSIIDGYVAAKYRTGEIATPPLLTEIACDLARHAMYRDEAPGTVVDARDQALKWLRDISTGTLKLDDGAAELPARTGAVLVTRPPRLFGRDSMGGF